MIPWLRERDGEGLCGCHPPTNQSFLVFPSLWKPSTISIAIAIASCSLLPPPFPSGVRLSPSSGDMLAPSSTLSSSDASSFHGVSLAPSLSKPPSRSSPRASPLSLVKVFAMAPKNKVNAYDDQWDKQWFGAGIFVENTESAPVNIVQKLEKKKLLSQVEKAGLLSKAESAGLTLSSIEKMGLLSKAEELGLLSLAENVAATSPATLASLSLPLVVAAIVTLVAVPDDSTALVIAQNAIATLLALGAGGLFVGSIVLSGLQED